MKSNKRQSSHFNKFNQTTAIKIKVKSFSAKDKHFLRVKTKRK